jgi:hypothetical protein
MSRFQQNNTHQNHQNANNQNQQNQNHHQQQQYHEQQQQQQQQQQNNHFIPQNQGKKIVLPDRDMKGRYCFEMQSKGTHILSYCYCKCYYCHHYFIEIVIID